MGFKGIQKVGEGVYRYLEPFSCLNSAMVDWLIEECQRSEKKRARICFHESDEARVHEMIVAVSKESFIRPHKHIAKTESFLMLRGEMELISFNENAQVGNIINLTSSGFFYVKVNCDDYHSVKVKSECAVFMETTSGPFCTDSTIFSDLFPVDDNIGRQWLEDITNSYIKG